MSDTPEPKKTRLLGSSVGRLGIAYFVLAISLLLTAVAWQSRVAAVDAERQTLFEKTARDMSHEIELRLSAYLDVLLGVRALFGASVSVERDEFRNYVKAIDVWGRYPGIQGIGFVRRVGRDQLDRFVREVRRDTSVDPHGYPTFFVFPYWRQSEYFVVEFVEPFATNRAYFGYLSHTDPARRIALERARDLGTPIATGPLTLMNYVPDPQTGFVIYVPVYRHAGDGDRRRRNAPSGFVFARFAANELVAGIFERNADRHVYLTITDAAGAPDAAVLYEEVPHNPDGATLAAGDLVYDTALDVAGRRWNLRFVGHPKFGVGIATYHPVFVLLGGGVISFMLFGITRMQAQYLVERRTQAEILEHQANHDSLSGLPNRHWFYSRVAHELPPRDVSGAAFALLLIDLNGFKEINDTLGHPSGDQVLREIGPHLRSALEPEDVLARLGGDEFAVALLSMNSTNEVTSRAERILAAIREPFDLSGLKVRVGASIGIALYPDHGTDISALMRCADVAMYVAKTLHRGFTLYEPALDQHSPDRLARMTELGDAIRQDQLLLCYQPIIDIAERRVAAVEALLRWRHPVHGLMGPDAFIAQAEKSELINPLTDWVIDNALGQCRHWRTLGISLNLAVNLSARNLLDDTLVERVLTLLAKHRLDPPCLQLEITESALILNREQSFATLARLQRCGIPITVDDFGTGYSSLAHLKMLPLRSLKIDSSFVRDMERDPNDLAIVRSTIGLAHNLGLSVIAEGVETGSVLDALAALDCDEAQGRFFSQPLPAQELTDWLARAPAGALSRSMP